MNGDTTRKELRRDLRRQVREMVRGDVKTSYRWRPAPVGRCEDCSRSGKGAPVSGELHVGRRVERDRDIHGRVARERWYSTGALCAAHAVLRDTYQGGRT